MYYSASHGRSTRTYRRKRAQILAASDICFYCGHEGADSVDHMEPVIKRPDLGEEEDNMVPAHNTRCRTCGVNCNNSKGTRSVSEYMKARYKPSRNWFDFS